ncbi:MAG: hypothetical protein ACMXYF_00615 [Candidatus Woesearchaeota archaeon]
MGTIRVWVIVLLFFLTSSVVFAGGVGSVSLKPFDECTEDDDRLALFYVDNRTNAHVWRDLPEGATSGYAVCYTIPEELQGVDGLFEKTTDGNHFILQLTSESDAHAHGPGDWFSVNATNELGATFYIPSDSQIKANGVTLSDTWVDIDELTDVYNLFVMRNVIFANGNVPFSGKTATGASFTSLDFSGSQTWILGATDWVEVGDNANSLSNSVPIAFTGFDCRREGANYGDLADGELRIGYLDSTNHFSFDENGVYSVAQIICTIEEPVQICTDEQKAQGLWYELLDDFSTLPEVGNNVAVRHGTRSDLFETNHLHITFDKKEGSNPDSVSLSGLEASGDGYLEFYYFPEQSLALDVKINGQTYFVEDHIIGSLNLQRQVTGSPRIDRWNKVQIFVSGGVNSIEFLLPETPLTNLQPQYVYRIDGLSFHPNSGRNYCGSDGEFNAEISEDACSAIPGLTWTGNRCCGLPDDQNYVDDNGVCVNGRVLMEEKPITKVAFDVFYDGKSRHVTDFCFDNLCHISLPRIDGEVSTISRPGWLRFEGNGANITHIESNTKLTLDQDMLLLVDSWNLSKSSKDDGWIRDITERVMIYGSLYGRVADSEEPDRHFLIGEYQFSGVDVYFLNEEEVDEQVVAGSAVQAKLAYLRNNEAYIYTRGTFTDPKFLIGDQEWILEQDSVQDFPEPMSTFLSNFTITEKNTYVVPSDFSLPNQRPIDIFFQYTTEDVEVKTIHLRTLVGSPTSGTQNYFALVEDENFIVVNHTDANYLGTKVFFVFGENNELIRTKRTDKTHEIDLIGNEQGARKVVGFYYDQFGNPVQEVSLDLDSGSVEESSDDSVQLDTPIEIRGRDGTFARFEGTENSRQSYDPKQLIRVSSNIAQFIYSSRGGNLALRACISEPEQFSALNPMKIGGACHIAYLDYRCVPPDVLPGDGTGFFFRYPEGNVVPASKPENDGSSAYQMHFSQGVGTACCGQDSCWTGVSCIDDGETLGRHTCLAGEWALAQLKFSPNGKESSFCSQPSQCYVGSFAESDMFEKTSTGGLLANNCVENQTRFGDYICADGGWASREFELANLLLHIADVEDDDKTFQLICDTPRNILDSMEVTLEEFSDLRAYNALIVGMQQSNNVLCSNTQECIKKACILNTNQNEVSFGVTIPVPYNESAGIWNFLGLSCSGSGLQKCSSNVLGNEFAIHYYPPQQQLIFSQVSQAGNIFTRFIEAIRNLFRLRSEFLINDLVMPNMVVSKTYLQGEGNEVYYFATVRDVWDDDSKSTDMELQVISHRDFSSVAEEVAKRLTGNNIDLSTEPATNMTIVVAKSNTAKETILTQWPHFTWHLDPKINLD